MNFIVATFEHQHGTDIRVFKTRESADKWRQEIAAEWWEDAFGDKPKPDDPEECADEYFDFVSDCYGGEEYFNIEPMELED